MAELKPMEEKGNEKPDGMAATFNEESAGDVALLSLAKRWWFKLFLIISLCFALIEPFLVAFPDTTYPAAQVIVLAVSSGLFLFGYGATMAAMESGSFFRRLRDGFLSEICIEVICFAIGWSLIFRDPGMASLRCFRIFRFVWYSEFYSAKQGTFFYPITFFCHLVLQYLEKIGQELCTTASKGGIVVLGFFFYMAYVFGVAFWQKTGGLSLISPEGTVGSQMELASATVYNIAF